MGGNTIDAMRLCAFCASDVGSNEPEAVMICRGGGVYDQSTAPMWFPYTSGAGGDKILSVVFVCVWGGGWGGGCDESTAAPMWCRTYQM